MSGFRAEFAHTSTFTPRGFASRLDFGPIALPAALRRCAHSVYWPEGQDFAHGCGFCNPRHYFDCEHPEKRDLRNLLAPERYIGSPRSARLSANKNELKSDACPKCGSGYHYTTESSVDVECADCGTHWRSRKSSVEAELAGVAV